MSAILKKAPPATTQSGSASADSSTPLSFVRAGKQLGMTPTDVQLAWTLSETLNNSSKKLSGRRRLSISWRILRWWLTSNSRISPPPHYLEESLTSRKKKESASHPHTRTSDRR